MRKALKTTVIAVLGVILIAILFISGYVGYMSIQYYRIDDNLKIETVGGSNKTLSLDEELSIMTYNIGFGAYSHDFSFFMDTGVMKDGTKVSGSGSRAKNLEEVKKNTNGAINATADENADFYFFQEVDEKATRSHNYNQYQHIVEKFKGANTAFSINFHSAYLLYPFNEPHGSVNAGIVTVSDYQIKDNTRRTFPIDMSFPTKFFDLDRCFMITRIAAPNGKELVLINLHMSAYDEGGKIRAKQLELLNSILTQEYNNGNYVVAGGDFNHDIANSLNAFESEQQVPEWVSVLDASSLPENFSFATAPLDVATCRSTDLIYQKGVNFEVVIDGFIVSNNIEVIKAQNIDLNFEFSDHNPVKMTFKLK